MNNHVFTPEKSLELITQIISEAKSKFEENGFTYILWGSLISVASIAQFLLLQHKVYQFNFYPYFILPFGGVATWIYYRKKGKATSKNVISSIISGTWIALAINLMVLGFVYSSYFNALLIPVMLILLGIGYVMSGISIRNRLVVLSGVVINLSSFVCIHLPWEYHSLMLSLVSLLFVLGPGLVFKINRKKDRV
jgi:hypothetical protein